MKTFLKKYYLESLTLIMFCMVTICAIFLTHKSLPQMAILSYMFLYTVHEWEEIRLPGGFSDLMMKFTGITPNKDKESLSHTPVVILLLLITFVPFFFDEIIILTLIPLCLALFEGFVHIVGIFIHKTGKPYTPGMISAVYLAGVSVYWIITFKSNGLTVGTDYLFAAIITFVCFAIMQRCVLAIMGYGYKDMIANVKKKFKK
ncbi:MAG: HXXEE domain-containing protein [Clostridia bacterium]|nr:HXXEE domain-containing protein [Clostridia bacterium]